MPLSTVLVILEVINGLLTAFMNAPAANKAVKALLDEVAAHVPQGGKDTQAAFIAAKQRLVDVRTELVNPRNGEPVPE